MLHDKVKVADGFIVFVSKKMIMKNHIDKITKITYIGIVSSSNIIFYLSYEVLKEEFSLRYNFP